MDWDAAGLGAAVLDFGALLGDCFFYPAQEITPIPEWITAVVDTYLRYHTLTTAELAVLLEAIRFGAAFRAAIRFSHAAQNGWQGGVIRGLSHEQARLAATSQLPCLRWHGSLHKCNDFVVVCFLMPGDIHRVQPILF